MIQPMRRAQRTLDLVWGQRTHGPGGANAHAEHGEYREHSWRGHEVRGARVEVGMRVEVTVLGPLIDP